MVVPSQTFISHRFLINSKFSVDIFEKAKNILKQDFHPIDDMRASKKYRLEVAENLLLKFFLETKLNKLIRVN